MKRKRTITKLSLNKQTIANLNKKKMSNIFGGDDGGNASGGINDPNPGPCDLWESLAIPELCEGKIPLTDKCQPKSANCTPQ